MKTYVKPVVVVNCDLAEGVYAASGAGESSDCWAVTSVSTQAYVDGYHIYEVRAVHSQSVVHITTQVTFNLSFSVPIQDAHPEGEGYDVSVNGSTVTVVRNFHANGYNSGDTVSFKVFVRASDEATTTGLADPTITYSCRHETNVQGGVD